MVVLCCSTGGSGSSGSNSCISYALLLPVVCRANVSHRHGASVTNVLATPEKATPLSDQHTLRSALSMAC
eukprot:1443-Heterococcus_DN1.PRE.14